MKCIFCDIIANKLHADVVFENENVIAFLDIKPLFPGHVLLIPKVHYETLWDLPEILTTELMKASQIISVAIKKALLAEGIFMANNNIVSQSVPHFHMHLVPRNKKDGLKGFFWPRQLYQNDEHKKQVRDMITKMIS